MRFGGAHPGGSYSWGKKKMFVLNFFFFFEKRAFERKLKRLFDLKIMTSTFQKPYWITVTTCWLFGLYRDSCCLVPSKTDYLHVNLWCKDCQSFVCALMCNPFFFIKTSRVSWWSSVFLHNPFSLQEVHSPPASSEQGWLQPFERSRWEFQWDSFRFSQ